MSLENLMSVQNDIRANSDELQNFLKDLDSWEKDMKKKEEELKLVQVSDDQAIPPIRNSLSRSKKKNRHKKNKEKTATTSKERISSFNYKAWEQFDVDSELQKLDEEKKEKSDSDSSDSEERLSAQKNQQLPILKKDKDPQLQMLDPERKEESDSDTSDSEERLSAQKKQQLAILKKDKGNDFFKNGNYDSAINCYTIGMELDPENALLPANRAMAFLKKDQFQAAENDCTLCLSLDPTYVKAYLRRGTARKGLKKLLLAESDFLKTLELEPENKKAQSELDHIHAEIIATQLNDVEMADVSPECLIREHCKKDSTQGSLPKLDVPDYSDEDEFILRESVTTPKHTKEEKQVKNYRSVEVVSEKPTKLSDKKHKKEVTTNESILSDIKNVVTILEQTLPPVPSASFQFLTDWKKMSKYPELQYQYLKQFPPEKFPVLFKHNMEPELFPEILRTLGTSFIENGDDVFVYMKYLACVGRLNTMLMFMAGPEQNDLKKLISYIEMSGYAPSEIEALKKTYALQ